MTQKNPGKLGFDEYAEVVKKTVVVKNDRGEILVGLRNNAPAKGYWFVPGGRILKDERIAGAFERIADDELGIRPAFEDAERIAEAFERIAYDELGIRPAFKDARFLGVFEHLYPNNFTEKEEFSTHYVVLAYEIKIAETALNPPRNQHSEHKWLTKQSLDKEADIHPYTRAYFDCSQ
ncbi:MAG: NUDIX domain-containing protein [Planctomycetota bacterium]|jgi:colanic acid biosynthesis protein WcaH